MTTTRDRLKIDIGNRCTHCGVDTSFGAGNGMFVNRRPSSAAAELELQNSDAAREVGIKRLLPTVTVEGYMCPDCQAVECDECGEQTIEYHMVDRQDGTGIVICVDCAELRDKNYEAIK